MDLAELPTPQTAATPEPSASGAAPAALPAKVEPAVSPVERARMIEYAYSALFRKDAEFKQYSGEFRTPGSTDSLLADYLFAVEDEPHKADEVFDKIRWGGVFVYLTYDPARLASMPADFAESGFETSRGPGSFRCGPWSWIPFMGRRLWYFAARKLHLARPRELTERFTYHVRLVRPSGEVTSPDPFIVMKEVPTLERVMARLRDKFPQVSESVLEKRALKFTTKVFPLFLTREAAILKILHRDLPEQYRNRIPQLLHTEKDESGYAQRIWMNWMRAGGTPLTQIEFARQAADLLRVVHDNANIIHLDLRLDNFLITDAGVCFVDFGSAVRVHENIQGNPLLSTIFEELMRTSQIQRMLHKMSNDGAVTSKIINDAYGRVDKQVDLFYLAVQINQPLHNPDFAGLVKFDRDSREANELMKLTQEILKPADPGNPQYRSASDMLAAIDQLSESLAAVPPT